MANDNADQIAEWNGVLGHKWVELQADLDAMTRPFGAAALETAAPRSGERVIDVGCGCGDTSLELARAVGGEGSVVGVDVSRPMLEVARARAARERLANVSFIEADASQAPLPGDADLLFSRFGMMFFSDPALAFGRLRAALRKDGRCVFVCWRTARDNGWAMTPLLAARSALGIEAAASDPNAPGPFAFADPERLRALLLDAGFGEIAVRRFDAPILMGTDPRSAAVGAVRVGPTARLARETGPEHAAKILDAIERALAPLAGPDGQVRLDGSTWIVSAKNAQT